MKGFARPTKALMVEHDDLHIRQANHFDPNAYRLLVKEGYKQVDVVKWVHEPSEQIEKVVEISKMLIRFS